MVNWFSDLVLWKKIVFLIGIVLIIILAIILIPKYTGPEENCIFVNEKANLHDEYYVTVLNVIDSDNALILKDKNDEESYEIIGNGKHFIKVTILIERINSSNPKENHTLDLDDFKLKDHTGVQIKNVNLFSVENGLALENKDFSTIKPIEDYYWFGHSIEPGSSKQIILYYEVSKEISSNDTVMVLEVDFFSGRTGTKKGTDFVLANRK